jgi:hypothetical protein
MRPLLVAASTFVRGKRNRGSGRAKVHLPCRSAYFADDWAELPKLTLTRVPAGLLSFGTECSDNELAMLRTIALGAASRL